MSDAFFARVFHARRELVPFGTVTLTTYFHVSAEDLAAEDITHVLACADAKAFNRSYQDQSGELWSSPGKLLATPTQMGYFKACLRCLRRIVTATSVHVNGRLVVRRSAGARIKKGGSRAALFVCCCRASFRRELHLGRGGADV